MSDVQLHFVESTDEVLDFFQWLGERRDWLAFDLETTGLSPGRESIRLCQFGDENQGWALPYKDWRGAVAEVFRNYDGPMVAHNLIFDASFLKADGITVPSRLANDTMVMAHLDSPMSSHALKTLAVRHIDRRSRSGEQSLKQAKAMQGWDWATIPVDFPGYWAYGALDCVLTAKLAAKLWPKIERHRLLYETEIGAISVLKDVGPVGMAVDLAYCERQRDRLGEELAELRPKIPLSNPLSNPQVIEFLESRGVPLIKQTERGQKAVDDDVLEQAAAKVPEAAHIQEYRGNKKLLSSYFENILRNQRDGVVHPSIRPLGARTGRMSITEPALQTLPRGRVVRDAFIARPGTSLLFVDYRQMEYRAFACISGEEKMLDAFRKGEDLHDFTAKQVFQTEDFTKAQRSIAKNASFANLFMAGVATFAATAGVSIAEGEQFMEMYHKIYPGVREFQQKVIDRVQFSTKGRIGEVFTRDGRRLPVEKDEAYKGINYMVQSSCAGVLKKKIVELDAAGLGGYLRLPVHDELIFEVPDEELHEVAQLAADVMTDESWEVPLTVDVDAAKRWGEVYDSERLPFALDSQPALGAEQ